MRGSSMVLPYTTILELYTWMTVKDTADTVDTEEVVNYQAYRLGSAASRSLNYFKFRFISKAVHITVGLVGYSTNSKDHRSTQTATQLESTESN